MTSWRTKSRYIDKMADDRSKSKNIVNHLQNITDVPENRIRTAIEAIDGESDIPENRIQAVIEAIDVESGGEATSTGPLSQSPSTKASPRPALSRRLHVNDVAYLSTREFARVLGLTLEQFDGNTVRPPANETVEVDLFWNRQRRTLGIRTITSAGETVGENHITPMLEGRTTSEVTRAPSALLVVTNGTFSDQAKQAAEDNRIRLFDSGHLEQWFRRVLIPFDAVGTVLEEGENHDGPLDDLVTLPTPPEPRCGVDPLELERVSDIQTGATDEDGGATREELLKRLQSLHDQLDRFPRTGDLQDISSIAQNDYMEAFGSWDEALEAAGIDKEQALLDEIERVAERVGTVPSTTDMDEYGTYSTEYYQSHFESWSIALERSGVEESDDSESADSSRKEMIETITQLYERLEHIPKTTELPEECEYAPHEFYEEFGSWNNALLAAGLDKKQALLDEIERVAEKLGHVPSTTEMQEHGPGYDYTSYFNNWNNALLAAGIDKRQALLEDIERVAEELGRPPNYADMSEYGDYSGATYTNHFGSWSTVLRVSGVRQRYGSGADNTTQKSSTPTDEAPLTDTTESYTQNEVISEIETVQQTVHREPTRDDFKTNADIPISAVDNQFDSWTTAVDTALAHDREYSTPARDSATLSPDSSVDKINNHVAGVGPTSINMIKKAGYETLGELHDATPEEVTECKGIGRAKAVKIFQFVTECVSESRGDTTRLTNDRQPSPGKKGVLYADPEDDGDYQMFDDYLEGL